MKSEKDLIIEEIKKANYLLNNHGNVTMVPGNVSAKDRLKQMSALAESKYGLTLQDILGEPPCTE